MAEPVLSLVVIRSADLERAGRFYAALGVNLARERHGSGPEHLAGSCGGVVLEVYPQGSGSGTAGVRLGFRVADLEGVVAALAEAGGSVVSPPRQTAWGRQAVVADPDGHKVELTEGMASPGGPG